MVDSQAQTILISAAIGVVLIVVMIGFINSSTADTVTSVDQSNQTVNNITVGTFTGGTANQMTNNANGEGYAFNITPSTTYNITRISIFSDVIGAPTYDLQVWDDVAGQATNLIHNFSLADSAMTDIGNVRPAEQQNLTVTTPFEFQAGVTYWIAVTCDTCSGAASFDSRGTTGGSEVAWCSTLNGGSTWNCAQPSPRVWHIVGSDFTETNNFTVTTVTENFSATDKVAFRAVSVVIPILLIFGFFALLRD